MLSTLTVTNNHDSGPGSLRATIAASTSGDTIDFSSKLSGQTIKLTSGELTVGVNLTIDGPGANQLAISGDNASRVFEIAAGLNVTISGVTVTHGYGLDQGGGILNDGSNLTLCGDDLSRNVAFESATTAAFGGALESLGGTLTISGCQITGNEALGAAGPSAAGDAAGGGIALSAGSATITNSTISGNLARGGAASSDGQAAGGAIYSLAPIVINQSALFGNQPAGGANSIEGGTAGGLITFASAGAAGGGAIYSGAAVTVNCSSIIGNRATGGADCSDGGAWGGTLLMFAGSLAVSGSTISGSLAIGGNDSGGQGEQGDGIGGAFACYVPTTITASTFSGNTAIGGSGGTGGFVGGGQKDLAQSVPKRPP